MFNRIEMLIGKDNLNLIKNKIVLIIGLGGVGGSSLVSLVRSGIQNLILIDFDIVDDTNINRQSIAFEDTIGEKKTDASVRLIKNINSNCNVKIYDIFLDETNIEMIFEENNIDYVIDAIDSIKSKKAIIMECLKRKIKFISSMGTGNKLDPTKLEIIDIRKTNNDPIARIIRKWVKENKFNDKIMTVSSNEVPINKGKIVSSLCFVPNTAGILMANYIIKDIIKK